MKRAPEFRPRILALLPLVCTAALALAMAMALAMALPVRAADPGARKTFEKTLPFTPDRDIAVGIRTGEVTIESARIRNWPSADDFEKARRDPSDKSTAVVEFTYTNRDRDSDWKCLYLVTVPGTGALLGENDRTATLDRGKVHDTNKIFVKMRTADFKVARTFKVRFEIWRK